MLSKWEIEWSNCLRGGGVNSGTQFLWFSHEPSWTRYLGWSVGFNPMVPYIWYFCSHWLGNYLAKPSKLNLANQNISSTAWKLTHLVVLRTCSDSKEELKEMEVSRGSYIEHSGENYCQYGALPVFPTPAPCSLLQLVGSKVISLSYS